MSRVYWEICGTMLECPEDPDAEGCEHCGRFEPIHEEIVYKSYQIDKRKLIAHKALTEQQLPIPPDLDRDIERLREIAQTRSPAREWLGMQKNYPELIPYLLRGTSE